MLDSVSIEEHHELIRNYAQQLQELLLANETASAKALLDQIEQKHDNGNELEFTISVTVHVLDNILYEPVQSFPRALPPKDTFTREEKDRVLSQLLDLKAIWISDIENFSRDIKGKNALTKYELTTKTKAYELYQAIFHMDQEKALNLLGDYFSDVKNEKLRIELASRMLEMVYKWNNLDLSPTLSQKGHTIIKALLSHGAQIITNNLMCLSPYDNAQKELAQLAANSEKGKYRYLVG